MRNQGLSIASGSEKEITDEKDWFFKHSTWEEDDASSSYVPRHQDDDPEDDA
jgi:hypothetical protein